MFEGIAILIGSIDGQGGHNTLSYADFGSSVNVQITGSDPNGYQGAEASTFSGGGFQGIDNIIASPAAVGTSILTGDDSPSTWDLGATQTYSDGSVTPLSFSGFAILQGGAGIDTFNVQVNTTANLNGGAGANAFVSHGVTLTGSIAGGAGTDTLDLSAYTTTLSATLTGSDATGLTGTVGPVTGNFTGINVLIAGSGTNTLTGESVSGTPSTWNLSGTQCLSHKWVYAALR